MLRLENLHWPEYVGEAGHTWGWGMMIFGADYQDE